MKNDNRSIGLWVIITTITVSVIGFTQMGGGFGVEYSLVSGVAVAGWFSTLSKPAARLSAFIGHYVLSIVCLLVLSTFRYTSHYGDFVYTHYAPLFGRSFVNNPSNWFLIQVCLPVSLLLWGGYFLTKRATIGIFFAWWGLLYCVVEALNQFVVEIANGHQYTHLYYERVFTAMGQFVLGISGLFQLVKGSIAENHQERSKPMTSRQINLWSGLFISAGSVYAITLYAQAGPLPVGVIIGSMMGGLVGWRKTTARHSADPYKAVPLYLLLQALFYVHVGEEVLTHFNRSIALISGHTWPDAEFDYLITLIGPTVWVYAAYSLWKGQAFGNFILWFMIVGMILGEPTHLVVFPVVRMIREGVAYEYFPGMYTALFPMIPAILALLLILDEHRKRSQQLSLSHE